MRMGIPDSQLSCAFLPSIRPSSESNGKPGTGNGKLETGECRFPFLISGLRFPVFHSLYVGDLRVAARAPTVIRPTIDIRPLSGALGAEIFGADLAKPLSDELFDEVRAAFLRKLAPGVEVDIVHPADADARPNVTKSSRSIQGGRWWSSVPV
jgi:hypothetical protein